MESLPNDASQGLRRTVYLLLAVTALGSAAGRIMQVRASTGETPMLSANDRSRWCTIAALVDEGTYAIDSLVERRHAKTKRRHWYSIDMVRHRAADGQEHFYSSKPPLLPTLLAGEYWLIKKILGLNIVDNPFYVMRAMLLFTNGLLLICYFWLMAGLIERLAISEWGRIMAFAIVTWATFITTYSVTLNNHLPAAVAVLVAIALVVKIESQADAKLWIYLAAGVAAGFAVANELPALSFLVLLGAWIYRTSPVKLMAGYLPGCLLVALAFFGTNYFAHGTWRPAYAHRNDGAVLLELDVREAHALKAGSLPAKLPAMLRQSSVIISTDATVSATKTKNRWMLWDQQNQQRLALVLGENAIQVHSWGNWYEYPKSYWLNPQGVDQGEPSRIVYAGHMLFGHHGVFSLTPIWLLSFVGAYLCLRSAPKEFWFWGTACLLLTAVCMAFYVARPLQDRNYGGVSCGFRWLIWLIPLWTITLLPALDRVASKPLLRRLMYVALFVSVVSASYPGMNPWSHPWLFDFWTFLGWLPA